MSLALAGRLKSLRLELDFTYQVVAEKTGLSTDTIRRAEMGESLNERTAYKIEKFIGQYTITQPSFPVSAGE